MFRLAAIAMAVVLLLSGVAMVWPVAKAGESAADISLTDGRKVELAPTAGAEKIPKNTLEALREAGRI